MNEKTGQILNGVYDTISEEIGFDNAVKIYNLFCGCQINFPTRLYSKEFVQGEAKKRYNGTNQSINNIATKYNYSERTIRKMLQDSKKEK